MRRNLSAVLVMLALPWAASQQTPRTPQQGAGPGAARRTLSVALFPWLPDAGGDDFKAMKARIKKEFESANPDVLLNLEITTAKDAYQPDTWAELFGPSGSNVVEVDSIVLGDLVKAGYIRPVPYDPADAFPEAQKAVRIDGVVYAAPTWVCSTFIFSQDPAIATVKTVADVIQILSKAPQQRKTVADFLGSFTLPALYLKGYADMYGYAGLPAVLANAATTTPDPKVIKPMHDLMDDCTAAGQNPCLDATYHNDATGVATAKDYAEGRSASLIGYSERLHHVRKFGGAGRARDYIAGAPFSEGNAPLIWVDGLVISAKNCGTLCQADAAAFGRYLNLTSTRRWITFSDDANGAPPRYLLPAQVAYYADAKVKADSSYSVFEGVISHGKAYPNQGYPAVRKILTKKVCNALKITVAKCD